jgi:acyl-CoA thioesterase-1
VFPRTDVLVLGVSLAVAVTLSGCDSGQRDRSNGTSPAAPPATTTSAPESAAARDDTPRIIFLGDSLTAGLGLDIERSYPSLIEARLKEAGYDYAVVNAGVSGDTSAGGLRRLEWALGEGNPKVLVVALGGNDGLRGLPPAELEKNLAAIIEEAQGRDVTVILAGMEAPPNFGADYTNAFREVYPRLARKYDLTLVPFLLQGVAGDPALNQSDGIHPNERGAQVVADTMWRALEPALEEERSGK